MFFLQTNPECTDKAIASRSGEDHGPATLSCYDFLSVGVEGAWMLESKPESRPHCLPALPPGAGYLSFPTCIMEIRIVLYLLGLLGGEKEDMPDTVSSAM